MTALSQVGETRGIGLENRCGASHRGFKSHSLRSSAPLPEQARGPTGQEPAPERRKRRRRREFVTTNTLENAIAPAAITGDSNPAAARGIAATL